MIRNNNDKTPQLRALYAGFKPTFYYETFREYRNKLGFSLSEVAHIADKSLATVRRWEHQNDAPRWLCCSTAALVMYWIGSFTGSGYRTVNSGPGHASHTITGSVAKKSPSMDSSVTIQGHWNRNWHDTGPKRDRKKLPRRYRLMWCHS